MVAYKVLTKYFWEFWSKIGFEEMMSTWEINTGSSPFSFCSQVFRFILWDRGWGLWLLEFGVQFLGIRGLGVGVEGHFMGMKLKRAQNDWY